jgi:hypothetical protein
LALAIKTGVLNSSLLEDFMQWMGVTSVGVAAKILLDIGPALKSGTSLGTLLECLRGT